MVGGSVEFFWMNKCWNYNTVFLFIQNWSVSRLRCSVLLVASEKIVNPQSVLSLCHLCQKSRQHGQVIYQGPRRDSQQLKIINNQTRHFLIITIQRNTKYYTQEEVPEEKKKPPYSYASLIRLAIINSESQKVLSTIAQFEQSSDDFLASQDAQK